MRVGGQLHAQAALLPGKRPGTHCIGGWLGPRADLDSCGKSRPHWDSNPEPSSPQLVAVPSTLCLLTLLLLLLLLVVVVVVIVVVVVVVCCYWDGCISSSTLQVAFLRLCHI